MNLSRFATSHIKAILFVTLAACLVGAGMLTAFPVSILPDVAFPRVVVVAEAGEQPARMVESGMTRPLEEAISSVQGVTRVRSKTQRGASEISVDFDWGTDMTTAQNNINNKVNEVRPRLPAGAEVSVERMNPTVFPVLGLSLRANNLSQAQLWSLATYTLRPRLARVPGVARAVVQGGRTPEIAVEVDPRKLAAYQLSLPDVETALTGANVVRSVGRLNRQFQQYEVLVSSEATLAQLQNTVVTQRNGVPILLRYLADVHPSTQDRTTVVTADGAESVLINIVRQPSANTVAVVAAVEKEVAALRPALPRGAQISVFYDQSILIGDAITSVRDAVLIGAVLSVVVLMLFLGDWRATVVTAAIIPATVLITFGLMRLAGLTLNLMTLGALAVGIGLVIDDAIVVVENVFRQLSHGNAPREAVSLAAREIAAPMISSTLTAVVVFAPLVLLQGVAGAFFTALAVTLVIALLVSLVLALLVSPSLCAAFLRVRPNAQEHGRLFERAITLYGALLKMLLRRPLILPVGVVLIAASTYMMGNRLGTGFMPEMDEGAFVLDYNTAPGTTLEESDRLLRRVEAILKSTPEVGGFSRRTGTEMGFAITEPNRGDFAIMVKDRLPDGSKRRPIRDVMEEVRTRVQSQVPGLDIEFMQVLQDLIGDLAGASSPLEVKLWGENQAQLEVAAEQVAGKMEKIKGAVDVVSGVVESGPELVTHIDPIRAGRAGLSPDDVASQANAALYGDVVTRLLQGDRQTDVRVRFPMADRLDIANIESLPIRSPQGYTLPLSSLGRIETVPGTSEVSREDQRRLLSVTAGLDGTRDLGGVVHDVQNVMQSVKLPTGVIWTIAGQYQSQNDSFRNLLLVLGLAILLVFAVMLFQFGSFTAPLTILLVMPLSLFGVTLSLWMTNTPVNVSSFMGAVMLAGIVVKNGILLLDQAQKAEDEGVDLEAAVVHAGRVRLRPILMTTLTAILGLVPLALGLGAGAEMQKPLAIAVIGGLSFSTVFTLLLAPMLYVSLRRLQLRFAGREKILTPVS